MRLYLMRHGEAFPVGGAIHEDSQRPLSPRGKNQVRRVAEGLKRHSNAAATVISSPLRRAQETARIVADVMGLEEVQISPSLAPNAAPAGLRTVLAAHQETMSLLLVGHHPDVTIWTGFLAGLAVSVCPVFGTASIAALDFDPHTNKAEFLWFQTSDQLSQT